MESVDFKAEDVVVVVLVVVLLPRTTKVDRPRVCAVRGTNDGENADASSNVDAESSSKRAADANFMMAGGCGCVSPKRQSGRAAE